MAHLLESHSLIQTPRDLLVSNGRETVEIKDVRRLSYNGLYEADTSPTEEPPAKMDMDPKTMKPGTLEQHPSRAPSFVDHSEDNEEDRYAYTFLAPPLTPTCRVVDVSLTIERVFDVDTVTQTFGVQVTVMMSWLMPEFEEPKPPEMDDGDWVPEWTPKYQFKNLMANIDMTESYFPYKDSAGVERLMLEAQHVVRIYEQMELEKFPVDCQDLTLEIQMKQTTMDVFVQPLVEEGRPSFNLVKANCFLNDFSLMEIPCVFGVYINRPHLRKGTDLNRKGSYGKAVIGAQVKIERMVSFYVSNVMGVLFPIATFAISGWSLHPTDIEGRLAVDFQLILTAVAFKLVLNSMTPSVSYMTVLDLYVLGCFGFLTVVTVYHASYPYIYGVETVDFSPLTISPETWTRGNEDDLIDWDVWCMIIGSAGWVLFNLIFLWYFKSTQNKTNRDFMLRAKEESEHSAEALHVITRHVANRDYDAATEIKGSKTFQSIKEADENLDDDQAAKQLLKLMSLDVCLDLSKDCWKSSIKGDSGRESPCYSQKKLKGLFSSTTVDLGDPSKTSNSSVGDLNGVELMAN